jgi:hypothetical protein
VRDPRTATKTITSTELASASSVTAGGSSYGNRPDLPMSGTSGARRVRTFAEMRIETASFVAAVARAGAGAEAANFAQILDEGPHDDGQRRAATTTVAWESGQRTTRTATASMTHIVAT